MKFIPNASLKDDMLRDLGIDHIDDLFDDIPSSVKRQRLTLHKGRSQQETERILRTLANRNLSSCDSLCFTGGGIKPHYIPAVVRSIISRGEFLTAYTPYQSEASQGFLQAMFEYQSMIAEITGMDVANCSLYDGATALAEAMMMCSRVKPKKQHFLIPTHISWEKKSVLKNYAQGIDLTIKEIPYDTRTGMIDIEQAERLISSDVCGIYIENPNFFGMFEQEVTAVHELISDVDGLFVVGVDPLSLGIVKNPGEYGADIVVGEARALGNPMDLGGSSLGLFACRSSYLRQMPGRLIGKTSDAEGNDAFCMTLQTREQHIRRQKATSNICTNEGLCALAATVYLAWLGGNGFQALSKQNFEQGQLLEKTLTSLDLFESLFSGVHFNECALRSRIDASTINKTLLQSHIHGGLHLDPWFKDLTNTLLFGVTELHSKEDIEHLATVLSEVSHV